jgi:hypothetical protein
VYISHFLCVASDVIAEHFVLTEHMEKKNYYKLLLTVSSGWAAARSPADNCLEQFDNSEICSHAFSSIEDE